MDFWRFYLLGSSEVALSALLLMLTAAYIGLNLKWDSTSWDMHVFNHSDKLLELQALAIILFWNSTPIPVLRRWLWID